MELHSTHHVRATRGYGQGENAEDLCVSVNVVADSEVAALIAGRSYFEDRMAIDLKGAHVTIRINQFKDVVIADDILERGPLDDDE